MLMVLIISALERKVCNATTSNTKKARCLPSQGGWCCLPSFLWCGAVFSPSLGMVLPFLPSFGWCYPFPPCGSWCFRRPSLLCGGAFLPHPFWWWGWPPLFLWIGASFLCVVLLSCLGWCFLPLHLVGGPPSSFWLALLPPALPFGSCCFPTSSSLLFFLLLLTLSPSFHFSKIFVSKKMLR